MTFGRRAARWSSAAGRKAPQEHFVSNLLKQTSMLIWACRYKQISKRGNHGPPRACSPNYLGPVPSCIYRLVPVKCINKPSVALWAVASCGAKAVSNTEKKYLCRSSRLEHCKCQSNASAVFLQAEALCMEDKSVLENRPSLQSGSYGASCN